jgi:hypothetical protein
VFPVPANAEVASAALAFPFFEMAVDGIEIVMETRCIFFTHAMHWPLLNPDDQRAVLDPPPSQIVEKSAPGCRPSLRYSS